MYVKEVIDYDPSAQEADIIISDGQFDIMTYAQPFYDKYKTFELYAFSPENILRAIEPISAVTKIDDGYYAYRLQGKLIEVEKCIVAVGDIKIELGNNVIPKDIQVNEYIEFTVLRVDFIG